MCIYCIYIYIIMYSNIQLGLSKKNEGKKHRLNPFHPTASHSFPGMKANIYVGFHDPRHFQTRPTHHNMS